MEEAECDISVLEELGGTPHIIKMHERWKWENINLSLIVLDYKQRSIFQPRNGCQLGHFAYQARGNFYHLTLMLQALDCLHANKVVHADIKPDNIIVEPSGCVTLIDFGLAVEGFFYEARGKIGTTPYIAPEVINGERITCKADMWSFGILLFEKVIIKL